MAGLSSGLGSGPGPAGGSPVASGPGAPAKLSEFALSRNQFAIIAWLRWRIFVNTLRGKGAVGELVVKIVSYPILGIMILGPAIGACIASYYFVHRGMDAYLAIPLWIIFALWQFVGVSTSATGPSFDLFTLVRFPIRYRDYLLMRLSFGLMDPPTLSGIACLIASSLGIAIAVPSMFPWAALALFVYAACNVLFSRMIYSWMERWVAKRRTRELITGGILLFSLVAQFAAQFVEKLGHRGHHAPINPLMLRSAHILVAVNWFLPPGLAASSIEHMHRGDWPIALAALAGLLAFTALFLAILHLRLHAEYLGESLSEAPAAQPVKAKRTSSKSLPIGAEAAPDSRAGFAATLLPPTIAAFLQKEIRYLLRSGPKLYLLVMPIFVVLLFSMKTSGLRYAGLQRDGVTGMLFTYGCAYAQLIFVGFLYNSLGGDGAGIQFYFLAPLRMRDVMLAKNIMTGLILAAEIILIYIVSAVISTPASLALTAATVAWCLFAFFVNMSIGNVRSLTSPKRLDPAKVRGQNVSGMSGFIAVAVSICAIGLGSLVAFLCTSIDAGYWLAAGIFLVLAGIAFAVYLTVLRRVDSIAASHVEDLTLELCKR